MRHYSYEYNELMNFLNDQKINGVIFLTGDRHHSEIIKLEGLPCILCMILPYRHIHPAEEAGGAEANNPYREKNTLIEAQNYARISFSGKRNEREMKVEFLGLKGEKIAEWSINESQLKAGR